MVRTAAVALVACALAACGPNGTATKTTTSGRHVDPDAPRRAAYVVSEKPGLSLTAIDAAYLYWLDEAGLHRRPHGGPDQQAELLTAEMAPFAPLGGAMLVVGDKAYLFQGVTVMTVSVKDPKAKPETIATLATSIDAFSIAPDGAVYLASDGKVLEVAAGKEPKILAQSQGEINDIIADDKNVYIGAREPGVPTPPPAYYGAPQPPIEKLGALRRVPRDGGQVVNLATGQGNPDTLGLYDGRLWWPSLEGPAVSSVPIDGGEVRIEALGHADSLAVDAGGLVYRQAQTNGYSGMLVERHDDAYEVELVPDGTFGAPDRGILLTPDWTYVTAMRLSTSMQTLLAVPRQAQPIHVAYALDRTFQKMTVDDDVLYWAEISPEMDGHVHFMRGDRETGGRKELADFEGGIAEMTAGAGQLYFHDGYTISQVSINGGAVRTFDRADSWCTGLTVHRNHVYWMDGSAIYARKRRGGAPFVFTRNDNYYGYGYGYGDGGGDLVFDDDFVYTTGFGQGGTGLYQISERGKIDLLWNGGGSSYPGKDLVMLGDELFFTAGQGGPVSLMKVTLDGEGESIFRSRGDGYGVDLIEGGGMLYLQALVDGFVELTRIDPSTGEGEVVFRIWNPNGDYPTIASDSWGVYLGLASYDAIFRVAHDAPKVPDLGWPAGEA